MMYLAKISFSGSRRHERGSYFKREDLRIVVAVSLEAARSAIEKEYAERKLWAERLDVPQYDSVDIDDIDLDSAETAYNSIYGMIEDNDGFNGEITCPN